MSTRREEERNEKIIRGLMKLPPNRRCINCNSLGPQYVCVNFWTFICMTCSGIHREFTHRVKSVSMSKFASQEVEALQNGGNQRAKEIFLKHWDQRERLPSSNNIEKIRDFIKQVYVDRKYAAGISSEKPPRDLQSQGRMDDETRRASSYHSYSQSPPYDFQYEDRRNRKQGVILSRKPGSDRGVYEGNVSGLYSPGRFSDHISAERFAMERSTSQVSDFSMSSDPFRSYPQSPNSQKEVGFSSPTFDSSKDRSIDDFQHHATKTQTERTVSSASFGSFDSSTSLSPATSGNLSNVFPQLDQSTTVHQNEKSTSDLQPSDSANSGSLDLSKEQQGKPLGSFNSSTSLSSANSGSLFDAFSHLDKSTTVHENEASTSNSQLSASVNSGSAALFKAQQGNHFVKSDPPIDLFQLAVTPSANHFQSTSAATSVSSQSALFSSLSLFDEAFQSSLGTTLETNLSESSSTNNGGWATFDLPEHTSAPKILSAAAVTKHSGKANPVENLCSFSTLAANTNMPEFQGSVSHGQPSTLSGLWDQNLQNAEAPPGASSNQVWKAFEDNAELLPSKAAKNLQVPLDMPSTTVHYTGAVDTENSITALQKDTDSLDGVSAPTISRHATSVSPFDQFVIPLTDEMQPNSEHKSLNPFDIPYDTVPNSSNGLLDMSSLGASLPSMQLPSSFIECIDESWFPPDTTTSFMPAAPQGGAPFITAQAPSPQLPNVQTHGPVASVGGNPFA